NVNLPATASAGVRYIARDGAGREIGDVELDIRWENWSRASETTATADGMSSVTGQPLNQTVVRHGLRDTYSARLGTSGRFDVGDSIVEVRAGVAYESA